ncbi:hypothetical protein CC80DRAFT_487831 [Byssothecium circinans]|uniref:Translation initiation factor 3 N-terminal domain-containing protein n=1 Tax=Byssothecium circinans TaxID=147558 RepID=A0A6A5UHE7_9PLEO|nr:hypothetical protein CC80DRAFT_487831 [Byssothecium circinans]
MSRYHLTATSRALYRVFVASTPATPTPFRLQTPFLLPYAARLLPQTTVRHKTYKKDVQRHSLSDHFTFDNAIEGTYIDYVDDNGVFRPNARLKDVLRSFDRTTHHLVMITPGTLDEFGNSNPDDLPVCKVVSKMDLSAQLEKKLEIERRAAKGKGVGPDAKILELNWAIAGGDLKHRLEKLRGFLKEGRKVEVVIGPKRKSRVATEKECQELLREVRDAVDEVRGAREKKEPEGVIGAVMTLVFEGRNLDEPEEKKEKVKGEGKKKRKEREEMKAERRRKAAEEDRRNQLKEANDAAAKIGEAKLA